MSNHEGMREVTVYETKEKPVTIWIPEEEIREFEKNVKTFTNMQATILLATTSGYDEENYLNYTAEELADKLVEIMREEIEDTIELDKIFAAYIKAGEPAVFYYKEGDEG